MSIIDLLLKSDEPSLKFKTKVFLLNENPESSENKKLQSDIKNSPRVKKLLSNRNASGELEPVNDPYQKWFGAHWVLVHLAELCYPQNDKALFPLRDQIYDLWLSDYMFKTVNYGNKMPTQKGEGVPVINGKARRCVSQQGNALFSTLSLGIADERSENLLELILKWQWPDGGWNCDKNPEAKVSSFKESLIPLRGLAKYLKLKKHKKASEALVKASELFLKRNLFRKLSDGKVIRPEFLKLHYPCYWQYDILFALKVMDEAGFLKDERCSEALDILESKQLKTGGWRTGGKFYKLENSNEFPPKINHEKVDWDTGGNSKMNEWVTLDALNVLKNAGRINL